MPAENAKNPNPESPFAKYCMELSNFDSISQGHASNYTCKGHHDRFDGRNRAPKEGEHRMSLLLAPMSFESIKNPTSVIMNDVHPDVIIPNPAMSGNISLNDPLANALSERGLPAKNEKSFKKLELHPSTHSHNLLVIHLKPPTPCTEDLIDIPGQR
jgi:hypothetical protein